MDMTLDAAIARHCRAVLAVSRGNQRGACRTLGISWHTLRKYLRLESEPLSYVPLPVGKESTSAQLVRLQAAIPAVPPDVLLRELLIAEQRGAAEQARQLIEQLRRVSGAETQTLSD